MLYPWATTLHQATRRKGRWSSKARTCQGSSMGFQQCQPHMPQLFLCLFFGELVGDKGIEDYISETLVRFFLPSLALKQRFSYHNQSRAGNHGLPRAASVCFSWTAKWMEGSHIQAQSSSHSVITSLCPVFISWHPTVLLLNAEHGLTLMQGWVTFPIAIFCHLLGRHGYNLLCTPSCWSQSLWKAAMLIDWSLLRCVAKVRGVSSTWLLGFYFLFNAMFPWMLS